MNGAVYLYISYLNFLYGAVLIFPELKFFMNGAADIKNKRNISHWETSKLEQLFF